MSMAKPSIPIYPPACLVLLLTMLVTACGGGRQSSDAPSELPGQVASVNNPPGKAVSHYAASRLLEQAAMGPTPASVERVRALGVNAWVSEQMALPASTVSSPDFFINYSFQDKVAERRAFGHFDQNLFNIHIGAEDQLRVRTSWILSNLLVVSLRKIQPYGAAVSFNLLQAGAFGQYGDLLKAVSLNPAMGFYLDNGQNRREQLNENYGRELLQLFSVGLVQLNIDGSVKRDVAGRPLETYNQQDVIAATRALTGWAYADPQVKRAESNGFNYGKPMQAVWSNDHDTGEKKLLGQTIPAGQSAAQDLDRLIAILVGHPNTAPFVSLRLIQGMTTSDPSPAYLGRVANVFKQTNGHLGAVVRAILTDPEARAGDVPSNRNPSFGRIKEPHLQHVSILRALGCRTAVRTPWNPSDFWFAWAQKPFNAYSVFNFYPPTHRTQGTNVLAPEQKMLNSDEFSRRLGTYSGVMEQESLFLEAGCNVNGLNAVASQSDEALVNRIEQDLFRGVMPASTRLAMLESARNYWDRSKPFRLLGAMLDLAAITPAFGVSK